MGKPVKQHNWSSMLIGMARVPLPPLNWCNPLCAVSALQHFDWASVWWSLHSIILERLWQRSRSHVIHPLCGEAWASTLLTLLFDEACTKTLPSLCVVKPSEPHYWPSVWWSWHSRITNILWMKPAQQHSRDYVVKHVQLLCSFHVIYFCKHSY